MTVVIDCNVFVVCLTSRSPIIISIAHLSKGNSTLSFPMKFYWNMRRSFNQSMGFLQHAPELSGSKELFEKIPLAGKADDGPESGDGDERP